MKISDVILDKEIEERRITTIKVSKSSQIKINLDTLTRLIKEILKLKSQKISAILKTKGIEEELAGQIFVNLLKYSPSDKEQYLTHRESLAAFLSKYVIIKWKGIKHRKTATYKNPHEIFFSLLINQPKIIDMLLERGLEEFKKRSQK